MLSNPRYIVVLDMPLSQRHLGHFCASISSPIPENHRLTHAWQPITLLQDEHPINGVLAGTLLQIMQVKAPSNSSKNAAENSCRKASSRNFTISPFISRNSSVILVIFAFTSSSSGVKDFLFLLYLSVVSFSSSSISAFCCKASSLTAKIFRDPTFQNAIPYSKIVIYQKFLHSRVSNKRTCTYVYFFRVKIYLL